MELNVCRKIPSCHSFKCWCRLEPGAKRVICDVYFHFLVILRQVDDTHLTTRMELVIHSISPSSEVAPKNVVPISHEFPLVEIKEPALKKPKFSESVKLVTDLLENDNEEANTTGIDTPLFNSSGLTRDIDQLPEPILVHHNNWERFPETETQQKASSQDLQEKGGDDFIPEYGDGEWLETLFQWALDDK